MTFEQLKQINRERLAALGDEMSEAELHAMCEVLWLTNRNPPRRRTVFQLGSFWVTPIDSDHRMAADERFELFATLAAWAPDRPQA